MSLNISQQLKCPKSGWFGHRETPGSSKIERYQPYYFHNKEYIGARELLLSKILDYSFGDFEISIQIEKNGNCEIKLLDEGELFMSANEESYDLALVAICKQTDPQIFK